MASLFEFIAAHEDPYEFIEQCLAYKQGADEAETCWELFNEVVFDSGLHPDDDFEEIIELMVEQLQENFA